MFCSDGTRKEFQSHLCEPARRTKEEVSPVDQYGRETRFNRTFANRPGEPAGRTHSAGLPKSPCSFNRTFANRPGEPPLPAMLTLIDSYKRFNRTFANRPGEPPFSENGDRRVLV